MSDFTHNFWSWFVISITLVGIVSCLVLLWITSKTKVAASQDNTTGHTWDGDLRENNNPLPMWWVGLFVITVIFSLAYLFLYPGLGSFGGKLGWTQAEQYTTEVAQLNAKSAPLYAKFAGMPEPEVAQDAQAMAIGERIFMNNCSQCHGSDARGSKGFPNLTDSDWLWGGSPEKIKETLVQGRIGQMPPMGAAIGGGENVKNLAHYVLSLSGSPHDSLRASLGKTHYATCAGCHGMDGKGNTLLGAPNLTDDIWLHGYGETAIVAMINNGKMNQMPAQADKLTPEQIHVLTAYVWSLSNKTASK